MDPYKVLGVTPQTSDDDVKRAYRELARKYHPDNYVNNPLADLAEARMKEINEAYDTIMSERSGKTGAGAGSTGQSYNGQTYGQSYGGQRTYAGPNAALYAQVRQAINQGNLNMAESLLTRASGRDAEWFFLTGTIYARKGWYDEAQRAYIKACELDPGNAEYRQALEFMERGTQSAYHPNGTPFGTDLCGGNPCLTLCCLYSLCNGGGYVLCC